MSTGAITEAKRLPASYLREVRPSDLVRAFGAALVAQLSGECPDWDVVGRVMAAKGFSDPLIVRALAYCYMIVELDTGVAAPSHKERLEIIRRAATAAIDPMTGEFRYPNLVWPEWRRA